MKVLMSILPFLLFSINLYADCSKDTDCKGERICEKGVCINPTSSTPPVNSSPVNLSPEETQTLLKMKREREIYLAKGRDALTATIVTHILTGVASGTGASVYLYTDQKVLSYIVFGFGGLMLLSSLATLGACLDNYGKARKLKRVIDTQEDPLYRSRRLSLNLPVPVIYKNGKHNFYGLSLSMNF